MSSRPAWALSRTPSQKPKQYKNSNKQQGHYPRAWLWNLVTWISSLAPSLCALLFDVRCSDNSSADRCVLRNAHTCSRSAKWWRTGLPREPETLLLSGLQSYHRGDTWSQMGRLQTHISVWGFRNRGNLQSSEVVLSTCRQTSRLFSHDPLYRDTPLAVAIHMHILV